MHKPVERINGARKVTRACVDASFAELEAAVQRCPRPTAKQRFAALEVMVAAPEPRKWRAPWAGLAFVVFVVVALALMGGCVPVDVAAEHAGKQAVNAYGLSQGGSSEAVRAVGSAESFAWRTQYQILTGEDVPAPGGVVWEPLPEAAPVAPNCPDYETAGGEHCGCPAPNGPCSMPCTGCCDGGCPCVNPPTGEW